MNANGEIPKPTEGQEKFLIELSRLIPESMWLTAYDARLRVGAAIREGQKKGVVRLLFFDPTHGRPSDVGPVVSWEDGSISIPTAVLDYLARH